MSQPLSQKTGVKRGLESDAPQAGAYKREFTVDEPPARPKVRKYGTPSIAKKNDETGAIEVEPNALRELIAIVLVFVGLSVTVTGAIIAFGVGIGLIVLGALVLILGVLLGVT